MTVPAWLKVRRPVRILVSLMLPAIAWSFSGNPAPSAAAVAAPAVIAEPATPAGTAPVASTPSTGLGRLSPVKTPAPAPVESPRAVLVVLATPMPPAAAGLTPAPSPTPEPTPNPTPKPTPMPSPKPTPAEAPPAAAGPAEPPAAATAAGAVTALMPAPAPEQAAAMKAVAWATSQLQSADPGWSDELDGPWSGYCEAFAEIAYGTRYLYPSAASHYQAALKAGQIHTDTLPPAGALAFYSGGPFGHVAISVGNGDVITTWGYIGDRYDLRRIKLEGFTNPYLGWSYR